MYDIIPHDFCDNMITIIHFQSRTGAILIAAVFKWLNKIKDIKIIKFKLKMHTHVKNKSTRV